MQKISHVPPFSRSSSHNGSLRLKLLNYGALVLTIAWFVILRSTLGPDADDFKQYWQAAVNLRSTGDPFVIAAGSATNFAGYFYPPLFTYVVQPIAFFDQLTGQVVWFWINCLALIGVVVICIALSGSQLARRYWGLILLGACIIPPTRLALQLGQISIFVALLLFGSLALVRRYRWLSGFLLALAIHVRIYPMLLALHYLRQRQTRPVVWWAIGFGLVTLIGSVGIYGFGPYQSFISLARNNTYPFTAEHNISLAGFFWRLFEDNKYAVPIMHEPRLARMLVGLTSALVIGMCLWTTRSALREEQEQLKFGMWLCAMMLISTTNGYYSLVLLLLPLLSIVRYLESSAHRSIGTSTAIATLLICIPPGWSTYFPSVHTFVHTGWGQLLLAPSLYGLCMYLVVLGYVVQNRLVEDGQPSQ